MRVGEDGDKPSYIQVAQALESEIASGNLAAGERLPSVRDLATRYDVAAATIQNALRTLRAAKLVEARSTRGYYVTDPVPSRWEQATPPSGDAFQALSQKLDELQTDVRTLAERVTQLESKQPRERSS